MKIKRVLFLSSFDYPTRYAHALHGLHMAQAFERIFGEKFLFAVNASVVPEVLGDVRYIRLFGPFGRIVKKMHVRRLLTPAAVLWFLLWNRAWRERGAALYVTDPVLYSTALLLRALFRTPVLAECHGGLNAFQAWCLSRADSAVFVTTGLRGDFIALYPSRARFAQVVSNAVDVAAFDAVPDDSASLKSKLRLSDAFLVGYIGRFSPMGEDKGLGLMIRSLRSIPAVHLLLVGGTQKEVETYAALAREAGVGGRTHIVEHVDSRRVPEYAKACDVLAYVPSVRSSFFGRETSPMKVFEYMAANRPMIVSDTPALREAVGDSGAFFVEQGSPNDFVGAVRAVQEDYGAARAKAGAAYERVRSRTWDDRARRIVQAVESVLS